MKSNNKTFRKGILFTIVSLVCWHCASVAQTPEDRKRAKEAGAQHWKQKEAALKKYQETACWDTGKTENGKRVMECQNYQEWERRQ